MLVDKIKTLIKNHPRLEACYMLLDAIKDETKAKRIVGLKRDPYTIIMKSYGDNHPNDNIYYINYDEEYKVNGFCSIYRFVLLHLAFADDINMKSIVRWGENTLYYDKSITNCHNAFEYYFNPVSDVSSKEVMECKHVVMSKPLDASAFGTVTNYTIPDSEFEFLGSILKKYVHLNNNIRNMFWDEMLGIVEGGKTLGVHVRATDYNKGYNRHPKIVTPEEYLYYTQEAVKEHNFEKVFLATDDENVITLFCNKFGEKLVYYHDIYRSKNGEAIHYGNDHVKRDHHKFLLGLEILKDFYTLGHCAGLIAGISNVSMCARIVKASTGEQYVYKNIINKGVNHNFHETRSFFKPMIKK